MLEDDEEGESIYLCVCVLFWGGVVVVEMCIQDTWQARDQPAH